MSGARATGATIPDDAFVVIGGGMPDVIDLDDLHRATTVLASVADHLDAARRLLTTASHAAQPALLTPEGRAARQALTATLRGTASPERVADDALDLVRRLRRAIVVYEDAESLARTALRHAVALDATLVSTVPGMALQRLGLVGGLLVGTGLVAVSLSAQTTAVLLPFGRADDFLRWQRDQVRRLPGLAARAVADGRTELAVVALASGLLGGKGIFVPPVERVRTLARLAALFLPDAPPTGVFARVGAPQLPVPRDLSGVIANVARSYREESATGMPGTPKGTISVQRLVHPDGKVAWVIEIPGTQEGTVNALTPMDLGTNARLEGGVPDDMTAAVLEVMHLAGIRSDEPVLLAGHSQGGMVATTVAAVAAGSYSIAAVVTVGSPDAGGVRPPGSVQVVHLRDRSDFVPQLDGSPDQGSSHVRVVAMDMEHLGLPSPRNPVEAHGMGRYVRAAEVVEAHLDDPQLRDLGAAVDAVLGPDGTTATTRQFAATRDQAIVQFDPLTGLPRPDRLNPVGGPPVPGPAR